MGEELSTTHGALRKWLDEAEVLNGTTLQLRKDLDVEDIAIPAVGPEAFEALRTQVLVRVERWQAHGSHALSRAINRVDLTEAMVEAAMARGGLHELAGVMVLRCLQKVLLRRRFAPKT